MKHNKQLEKVKLLKSIDCNILKYGNKKVQIEYYYCSCDPEEKDAICCECAKSCHKGHKISVVHFGMETCKCGLRCHKIENISTLDDYKYDSKCYFHKWSEYSQKFIFYIYKNKKLCMFCRNFCKESFVEDEVIRVKSDEIPECMCVHSNHDDIISILKKMNYIFFLEEYDFLDIMQVQLFNLIFKSKESFDNLYSNFMINLNRLKIKLKEKLFSLDLNFEFKGISFAIKNFSTLINNLKYFYYFDPKLKDFFDNEFIIDLLKKKFDYNMQNIWRLNANVITIFRKAVFLSEFVNFPLLKVKDVVNMNPLMRLIITSNIKNNPRIYEMYLKKRYTTKTKLNENNTSFIESLITILNRLVPLKINFNEKYIIIHQIYRIIKVFAKYNLLDSSNINKICSVNDDLLFRFTEYRDEISVSQFSTYHIDKINEITNQENFILASMIKTLVFIVFNTNDLQIERYLKGEIDINEIRFFHMKNPLSKAINHTLINLMNFSNKYYDKNADCENKLSILAQKNIKKTKSILEYSLEMISYSINFTDTYLIALRNLLGNQTTTYLKYLINDFNPSEKHFIEFLYKESLAIEEKYRSFFQLDIEIYEVMEYVKNSIEKFFDFTVTHEYKPVNLKLSGSSSDEDDFQNSFQNFSNIFFLNSDNNKKFKLYPRGNYYNQMDNKDDNKMINNVNHSNYRILINKSFYLFSVLKLLRILIEYNKKNRIKLKVELNEDLFEKILKLIYFYTEDNSENCVIFLSSNFDFTFNSFDKKKFEKFIDLYINCFMTLRLKNYKFSSSKRIFKTIKDLIIEILNNCDKTNRYISKILKLLKCFFEIPSLDHEKNFKKLKKLLIIIHTQYDILKEYKDCMLKREEHRKKSLQKIVESRVELEESTHSKFKNVHLISEEEKKDQSINSQLEDENRNLLSSVSSKINESISLIKYKTRNDTQKNENEIEKEQVAKFMTSKQKTVIISDIINVINKRMKTLNFGNKEINSTENRECTDVTADIEEKNKLPPKISRLFNRYLSLINQSFDMICTDEEKKFLETVMSLEEINGILRNYDLDISFRTEILKFFKLAYFSKSIDPTKMKQYISLFIESDLEKHHEIFDDNENLKFNENFSKSSPFQTNLSLIFNIIRLELKYYALVLTSPNNQMNTDIIITYLEDGIIVPLFHFVNLFLSKIFLHSGYQYLQLYEIIYYYLNLKFFIFENKHIFEKYVLMEQKDYFFEMNLKVKNKTFLLIYSNLKVSDLCELEEDFREISSKKFEIFNFKILLAKINRHLFDFIRKPKCKSILNLFTNSKEHYSKAKIQKLEKKLKEGNFLSTVLDNKVFDLIIKYENDKRLLDNSKFVKVLLERNYTKNNRFLLFRIFFYLINLEKQGDFYLQQCLFNILRLMQFDTKGSQEDIKIIFSNNSFNHKNLIEKLVNYLVIIIFNNSDPSYTKINKNYLLAVNILKILKFMCEEHNNYFQKMLFNKIKLEYISQDNNLPRICTLVDFFLCVLIKIIMLARWETVKTGDDENNIAYFYDIFFVIVEFLIEMVQGTKRENLENLLIKLPEMEKTVFTLFLTKIKKILLTNKNDSDCIYKVRKDLIDFIMCFLEEKNTPEKLIRTISSLFLPFSFLETIIKTMKKLFLKFKKIEDNINLEVINYKKIYFDEKMYFFFKKKFYYDSNFHDLPEFTLCNRMYQYIKLLALEYSNDDAIVITESIYKLDETMVKEEMKNDLSSLLQDNNLLHKKFHFLYYCIKFFEDITRSVYVFKEEGKQTVRVLFTINPLTIYLTNSTKSSFLQNVNRQNRYSKISFLLESCHFFYEEILYNNEQHKRGYLTRVLTEIDYKFLERIMFIFNLIINILMISFLHLEDSSSEEVVHRNISSSSGSVNISSTPKIITFGNTDIKDTVYSITILQILFNLAITICWFINKYPLSHILEKLSFSMKKTKEKKINLLQKINMNLIYPIIRRNEISFFIWNIFFSFLILYLPNHIYIYSIQILCIIKLSPNLQNVVKAVTLRYKQLFLAWLFIIITTFIFACFGYFLFYDYWDNHGDSDFCRSLIGCFMLNLNLGLREHGGAGDLLKRYSIVDYEKYMANFFFCLLYRIICMYILEEIVVGITIDTFAEIREYSNIKENDIASICFICGGNRDELEKKGMNFENHTVKEHNLWNYVDYIIGLRFVDKQDTNAINSYVISMIESNNIIWIPAIKKILEKEKT